MSVDELISDFEPFARCSDLYDVLYDCSLSLRVNYDNIIRELTDYANILECLLPLEVVMAVDEVFSELFPKNSTPPLLYSYAYFDLLEHSIQVFELPISF